MSEVWLTVGIPAAVALATGVYTTGGRAALARRAIRQELEIASMLPVGDARASVERVAQDKAVLYASRWIGPQPLGFRQHGFFLSVTAAGGLITWLAGVLRGRISDHPWLDVYLLVWMVSGIALTTLGLTLWVSLGVMADNAKTRAETVRTRRERVRRHLIERDDSQLMNDDMVP